MSEDEASYLLFAVLYLDLLRISLKKPLAARKDHHTLVDLVPREILVQYNESPSCDNGK